MIDAREVEACAASFGVPETQIVRDHLISHVVAALAENVELEVPTPEGFAVMKLLAWATAKSPVTSMT